MLPQKRTGSSPSFKGLRPSSAAASTAKRKNRSTDTLHEVLLRRTLWRAGFRYRKNVTSLPGKPDLVFTRQRVAIFCDGDFWHGRNWEELKAKLSLGHNAPYWVSKVEMNRKRDMLRTKQLQSAGWFVLRFWETDIKNSPSSIVEVVQAVLQERRAISGAQVPDEVRVQVFE